MGTGSSKLEKSLVSSVLSPCIVLPVWHCTGMIEISMIIDKVFVSLVGQVLQLKQDTIPRPLEDESHDLRPPLMG